MTQLDEYTRQLEEARRDVQQADDDMRNAGERLRRAQRRVEALSQIVGGLSLLVTEEPQRERLPVSSDEATVRVSISAYGHEGDTPRGQEAIRIILSESPRAWRQSELVAEVLRRGWIRPSAKRPDAAVRVATRRLADEGLVEKIEPGVYRWKFSDDASSEQSARADDEPEATTREGDEDAAAPEIGAAP